MSNRLPILAAKIKRLHCKHQRQAKGSAETAIEAGECLIEAKQSLKKHGAWLPWLRDCGVCPRTAQLYMRCARNKAKIKKRNVSHLSLRGMLRGLEKPERILGPIGPMPGADDKVPLAQSNWPSDIARHYAGVCCDLHKDRCPLAQATSVRRPRPQPQSKFDEFEWWRRMRSRAA